MRIRKAIAAHSPAPVEVSGFDATPERMAKGDSDVVLALIDRAGERPGKARRFRASHLDRLHHSGCITQRQWAAGEYYRNTHARCHFQSPVIADYGARIRAPSNPSDFGYGLPMLSAQAEARTEMWAMRGQIPIAFKSLLDALLLEDEMPRYGGNQYNKYLSNIRSGLDALAFYLW